MCTRYHLEIVFSQCCKCVNGADGQQKVCSQLLHHRRMETPMISMETGNEREGRDRESGCGGREIEGGVCMLGGGDDK